MSLMSLTPSWDPLGRVSFYSMQYIYFTFTTTVNTNTIPCFWHIHFCLLCKAGRWWRHGTNIVTLAALCAPTVTSTSNRRAISSWRGSCTVRLTLAPGWDHQRDTTSSQPSPLHRSTTNPCKDRHSCVLHLSFVFICTCCLILSVCNNISYSILYTLRSVYFLT